MSPEERQRALERVAGYGGRRLRCEACDTVSGGRASGWQAHLGREDDDTECIVVLCPFCAAELDG
jgi:hypothetical protein